MKSSKQSLSNYNLTTCDMGELIPIGVTEVLPADLVRHHTNLLIRVTPMAAPVMHKVTARVHHFYVPNRILWIDDDDDNDEMNDWEEFITGGTDGLNADTVPTISSTATAGNLLDHMGLPLIAGIDINAIPVRAYNTIYNYFYRDQDLCAKRALSDLSVAKISWQKDYFTTCRPWSSKGPTVSLPVGDSAPVVTDQAVATDMSVYSSAATDWKKMDSSAGLLELSATAGVEASALYANLANATGADIIAFRRALGMQRFAEMRARYGSRYTEYMRHLGSKFKGTLDRPEYLGGGQTNLNFSEIMQTANDASDRDFGVGDLYGHGIASMRSNKYLREIDEHGYIISLLSVRPQAIYTNGIQRHWLRKDREDFYQQELAFIGQQEVLDNELYADAADPTSVNVFGFQDRYQEYREQPSLVSNEFRALLDYWHLGRKFGAKPTLNSSFVECTPSKRIFNEQTNNSLWVMGHHSMVARRNIAKHASGRVI